MFSWAAPASNMRSQASVKVKLRRPWVGISRLWVDLNHIAHCCKHLLLINSRTLIVKCIYIWETRAPKTHPLQHKTQNEVFRESQDMWFTDWSWQKMQHLLLPCLETRFHALNSTPLFTNRKLKNRKKSLLFWKDISELFSLELDECIFVIRLPLSQKF